MATIDAAKNAIATTPAPNSVEALLEKAKAKITPAAASIINIKRLTSLALSQFRMNPELAKCTPSSLASAVLASATVGLEPINGMAYLLPFNNRRKIGNEWKTIKEVQFVIGYRGYVDLFYRHNAALSIDMQTVKEKDEFSYAYGTESFLKHVPAKGERGKAVGYYAVAKMKGGAYVFNYLSLDDVMTHAKQFSKTYSEKEKKFYDSSPWATSFDAMAMKTCLRQLTKLMPLSIELQRAVALDETSRDYVDSFDDVLEMPVTSTPGVGEPIEPEVLEPGANN